MKISKKYIPKDYVTVTLCDGTVLTEGLVFDYAQRIQKLLIENKTEEFLNVFCHEACENLAFEERRLLCDVSINNHTLLEVSTRIEENLHFLHHDEYVIPLRIYDQIKLDAWSRDRDVSYMEGVTGKELVLLITEYCKTYKGKMNQKIESQVRHSLKNYRKQLEWYRIKELETYPCPLIEADIDATDCYEIQSIRAKALKMEALGFVFDVDKSNEYCEKCLFNQFR
jgi:hypothetical protein